MTDDAELRARIEAQVAARRAGSASSDEQQPQNGDAAEPDPPRGPRALTPPRPWNRKAGEAHKTMPSAPVSGATRRGGVGPARPWLAGEPDTAAAGEPATDDAAESPGAPPAASGQPGLRPTRPWTSGRRGAPPAVPPADGAATPAGRTPSNPEIVLRGLAAAPVEPVPERRRRVVRRSSREDLPDRAAGRRERELAQREAELRTAEAELQRTEEERRRALERAADERAADERAAELARREAEIARRESERREAERLEAERLEAERAADERAAELARREAEITRREAEHREAERLAAERQAAAAVVAPAEVAPEPATYVPDEDAVAAYAAAAASAAATQTVADADEDDQAGVRARGRRRRARIEPPIQPRHAAVPVPPEPGDAGHDEPAPIDAVADEPVAEYPWQRSEDVDLDLHGAPTWDPGMYPPEPDEAERHRGRRAMRWLFAREPDADADAVPESLPEAEPEVPAAAAAGVAESQDLEFSPETALDLELAEEMAGPEAQPQPVAGEVPADVGDEERPSALSRVFGRRRRDDEVEDEDETAEQFDLPAPDAAFEEPWLRAGSVETASPAPPEPAPRPAPGRRPSPGPDVTPRRRPSPGPTLAAADETTVLPPVPASRPSPGPAAMPRRPVPVDRRPQTAAPRPRSGVGGVLEPAAGDDDEEGEPRGRGGRWRRRFVRGFIIVAIAALAAVLLRMFVVQPYYIPSASMEPTLHGCAGCNDDHVLVDKISYRAHDVRAGDIVVFNRPKGVNVPDKVLIKRVIALGGDKISLQKGRVFVNGLVLDEPYLNKNKSCYANSPVANFAPHTVPLGDVFVMGDNRCDSTDSRAFGPIPTSSIVGRAFAIIWPLNRIGGL